MLRTQLHGIKKGNQSIVVYIQKIKTIADSLAAIGEKVSDADLMMFVMNGLSSDYDMFVVSSQNRETPYTFGELKARLLSHEQFLVERRHRHTHVYDNQNTALYAKGNSTGYNNNRRNGNGNGGNFRNSQYQSGSGSANATNSQSNSHGNGRPYVEYSKLFYQICKKKGHLATRCFFRYHPPPTGASTNTSQAHYANADSGATFTNATFNTSTSTQQAFT
ncbi:uncharacterized protein LOC113332880 [Papaver somniferum]|uniref:uncharacterized protein LOC113332880 n=1 Tax=Papaver somniferum TaxID=3469 RepID=UPI000E6F5AE0|nr:uncharacterized protein LOC113332880 [Papaver somniferum]